MSFFYRFQRSDGTYDAVSEHNPVPVNVRGLENLRGDVVSAIDRAAEKVAKDVIAAAEHEAYVASVRQWHDTWAIAGQIEMTRKAMIWCTVGLGAVIVLSEVLCRFIL